MTLRVGRLTLNDPETVSMGHRTLEMSGDYFGSTLEETLAVRDGLQGLEKGKLITVSWTEDGTIDAFYHVQSANVEVATLNDTGFLFWSVSLLRLGGSNDVQLQSRITGTVLDNDFSVTESGAVPLHAPSLGVVYYDATSSRGVRDVDDVSAGIEVFGLGSGGIDYSEDPVWSTIPSRYYDGGCDISINGILREGTTVTEGFVTSSDTVVLSNDVIRLTLGGGIGPFTTEVFIDGSWQSATDWMPQSSGTDISSWERMTIIRNDPEEAIIRFVQGFTSTVRRLDLAIQRGHRLIRGYLTENGFQTMRIRRDPADAAVSVGNNSMRDDADDADGNRWVLGSAKTASVFDTTNGIIGNGGATPSTLDFYIGYEEDGDAGPAAEDATEIELQYYGNVVERVEAVSY